jgi:zinc transport system substrate-binding protein
VTSHTAFAYLAREYGLNQVAIAGLSSGQEPSTQELTEVATFARDNGVKYIFFESLVSPKLSETIANEVGAQTLVLDPLEGIPDDEIKQGKNYFTVMEDNLKNLQTALGCSN